MNDILSLLRTLTRLDLDCACFAAKSHWYDLNPPLAEEEVARMEAKHQCRFPSEYRRFITEIGNGGAGPSYGVFPLGQHDHGHDLSRWEDGYGLVGDLSKPFPLTNAWNLPDTFWQQEPDPPEGTPVDEEDQLREAWNARLESEYYATHLTDGAIPICHEGCALRNWLVVTGPLAGTVWRDLRADNGGIHPFLNADGTFMGFNDWYLDWLRKNIAQVTASHAQSRFAQAYTARLESLSDKKQMAFAAFCAQAIQPNLAAYAKAIGVEEARIPQDMLDHWLWRRLLERRADFPRECHEMVDDFLDLWHDLRRHLQSQKKTGPDDAAMKAAIFSRIAAFAFWYSKGSVAQLLAVVQGAADATPVPAEAEAELQWALAQLESEPSEWASHGVLESLADRARTSGKFLQSPIEPPQAPPADLPTQGPWWKRLFQANTS